jgi:hypothetical protein
MRQPRSTTLDELVVVGDATILAMEIVTVILFFQNLFYESRNLFLFIFIQFLKSS